MTTQTTPRESISIPLAGLAEAQVRIGFGGGELSIRPARPGALVDGEFEGGVIQKSTATGRIELAPRSPGLPIVTWQPVRWDVGVTAEIPIDLRLDTGANRSVIDLQSLRIQQLELHTGASDTTVRLPAHGRPRIRVECGFASVVLEVPDGVAARISGSMGLGAISVDESRFPRSRDGWASPDYDTAMDFVDITVAGGFGSVRVT
jgi:hypothetical protein